VKLQTELQVKHKVNHKNQSIIYIYISTYSYTVQLLHSLTHNHDNFTFNNIYVTESQQLYIKYHL